MRGWERPTERVSLRPGEVHVWAAPLDVTPEVVAEKSRLLDDVERARAGAFIFEKDQRKFTVARAGLRELLSAYLNVSPPAVLFRTGEHGKPFLASDAQLHFNVSHSGERVLYAFCAEAPVGVDVEEIRPSVDLLAVAERFFSRAEREVLARLSPAALVESFFTCWSRKEAYLKGRGDGLVYPLDAFEVALEPGSAAALRANRSDPEDLLRWHLTDLPELPGYKSALAVALPRFELRCFSSLT